MWTVSKLMSQDHAVQETTLSRSKERSIYGKRNGWNCEGLSRDHHWWKPRTRTQYSGESCRAARQDYFHLSREPERGRLTHPRSRSDEKESGGISARYR